DEAAALAAAFDVTDVGNFEGRSILHPVTADAASVMAAARQRLMAYRDGRTRPQRDEKVIASWNGLMLRAFADAGRVLDRPDLLSVAEANARFLLSRLRDRARMRRSYKDGRATVAGYLEDQVAVADGLLSLYTATFDIRWLDEVRGLLDEMLMAFWDEAVSRCCALAILPESPGCGGDGQWERALGALIGGPTGHRPGGDRLSL